MTRLIPASNKYLIPILRYFFCSTSSSSSNCSPRSNIIKPQYRPKSTLADRSLASICNDLKALPPGSRNLRHLDQLRQFVLLLQKEPEFAHEAWKSGVVPALTELEVCGQAEIEAQARMALALLGYAPPYAGNGLRILSIDGGGTRGLIPLAILKHLEELCQCPTHQMFDYVCGTSTGAILAGLLCVKKAPIAEAQRLYYEMSTQVFKMNNILGISQLFLSHAFYDEKLLQRIIRRNEEAEFLMYETSRIDDVPRLSIVSTVVNRSVIQPFLFTNYRHHPDNAEHAHYLSSCDVRGWEALMASTAAPGYFKEVKLGSLVHQDGGLLTNNPCAIALHEARLLWGKSTPIQCIISLGTGLYSEKPSSKRQLKEPTSSLRDKLTKIVASATDTEAVHTILQDVLPSSVYYRFQPELSEDIVIDESNPEKLEQLVRDAERFVRANPNLFQEAVQCLTTPKSSLRKAQDWADTYWNKLSHNLVHR